MNAGLNLAGNATEYLKPACDGQASCGFAIDQAASHIGDPKPGVPKDFDYFYRCGDRLKGGHIQGEASTQTAPLSCED